MLLYPTTALEPSAIMEFFQPIFEQAKSLQRAYQRFTKTVKVPFITVSPAPVNMHTCTIIQYVYSAIA